jgi:hypothetical protein
MSEDNYQSYLKSFENQKDLRVSVSKHIKYYT